MLGLRRLKLKQKDRNSLSEQWRTIDILSKESERELYETLRERISRDDISQLQFGLTDSGEERPTSEKILLDDSNLYAKFGKAMKIVGRSAIKMKAWELRDKCQYTDEKIRKTIKTIVNILEENGYNPPKDQPDFPGLEKHLDDVTLEFLKFFPPEEDVTDYPSEELLYIVRNIAIFKEMLEMVNKLKQDIGEITKE